MMAFVFHVDTRSAWRGSLNKALSLVERGKLSPDDFRAAARPSPDARDPAPEAELAALLSEMQRRSAARHEHAAEEARQRAERDAWIADNANERVWYLAASCGAPDFSAAYTLRELERWADWAAGYAAGDDAYYEAWASRAGHGSGVTVLLNMYASGRRSWPLARCAADLAKFTADAAESARNDLT